MFENTRLKLTLIYVFIIMMVSIFFSLLIYFPMVLHLERGFKGAQILYRAEKLGLEVPLRWQERFEENHPELKKIPAKPFFEANLKAAKKDLLIRLVEINFFIFIISFLLSYYFAGRVLSPIAEMVEEQKRFISDASHQLRTPLTALKTSFEVEIRNKKNPPQARKIFKKTLAEINSLIVLSNNLLSSLKKPNFKKININDCLQKTIKDFKKIYLAKKIKVNVFKNVKNPFIYADFQAIEKMLAVFLDNAIKYAPEKGKVDIFVRQEGKKLILEIKDNGKGIDPKDLPHIFERFYQGKNGFEGYGLGLSLAKSIIEQHHGSVSIKSKLNEGTTFIIKLPLQTA